MRIRKNDSYIFFGDCDGFNGIFNRFAKLLINFLESHYKIVISMNDVFYTENKSKSGSFHYSIPKIHRTCEKLKEIHQFFYEKHEDLFLIKNENNRTVTIVDTTTYTNKWFRYPK